MPALIPVAIGLAATLATGAAIGAATVTIAGFAIATSIVAGVIGTIVSTVASIAMSSIMKPKKAAAASPQAESEARKQTIRGGIEARQVIYGRVKVGGVIVYSASSGTNQQDLHLVVVLAGHPCDAVESVFLNDEEINLATDLSGVDVTAGRFAGNLSIRTYTGGQTTADSILVAESPDGWASDHVLSGCTYMALRLRFNQDKFPNGLQSVAAVVRGKSDIYDPRSATTGYSTNWALCVLDYLRGAHGLNCDADELDLPFFSAAANLSDEAVQLDEAATQFQPRYTINGAFTLDQAPMDIIEKLLAAGAGTLVYVQGQYRLYGGAYSTPTVSLGASDFAGDVELETRAPRRELFNSIRGTFVDPARAWQAAEWPPLVDAGMVAEDGEQIWRDLPLDCITDGTRAQRLARIAILTARDSLRLKAPVRYAGLRLAVWQMVSLTLPDFGWAAKPFRIESWAFEPATGQVMLTLREENAFNYAWYWDTGASIPPSPNTTLVDPLSIPAVTGVAVTPGTVLQPDGGILPVLDITWVAAAHPFVTAHEVQWSLPAEDYVGQDVRMPALRHTVRSVQAGQDYRVRVRAVAGLVRGPWSSATVATSAPDVTPPATPTGLSATGIIRGVALRWTNPTAADFQKVEVDEGSSATGPWAKIGETPSDFFTRTNLTPGSSAWFRVRALDRSGNASAYSAAILGTASYLIASDIQDGIINTAKFASGIAPVRLISSTGASGAENDVAFNTTDQKLYKRVGGVWVAMVNTTDISGMISNAQITGMDAAKLAGQVVAAQIGTNAIIADKISQNAVTASKLYIADLTNLVRNPIFSLDRATGSMDGWSSTASSWAALSTTGVSTGTTAPEPFCARCLVGTSNRDLNANNALFLTVTPGETFYVDFWCCQSEGTLPNATLQACFRITNISGGNNTGNFLNITAGSTTGWTRHTIQYTVPATVVSLPVVRGYFYFRLLSNASPQGSYHITGVKIRRSANAEMVVDGSIIAAKIATDAVTADKILAGSVTTAKLSVASTNLIWNSCATGDLAGWAFNASGGITPYSEALAPGNAYRLDHFGSGRVYALGTLGSGAFINQYWDLVPVTALARYQAQALIQASGCSAVLQVQFYNTVGTTVGTVTSAPCTTSAAGGTLEAQYTRLTLLGDAPASAVTARLFITGNGTGASNPNVIWTKTSFGPAPPNATEVGPWEPGGVTQVSGGQIVTRTILADRIVASSITANELAANAITADKITANAVTFGKVAAGAIRSAEIATGELRAIHMASETIIASTVQVANLIIGTEKITAAAVTTVSYASAYTSGYVNVKNVSDASLAQVLASLTVTVTSGHNGRLLVQVDENVDNVVNSLVLHPSADEGGGGDGGSGGGGGE
jgi:hypothetical protein